MKSYAFGVDVGGTTIKLGLFKSGRNLAVSRQIPTRSYNHGEMILPDVASAVLRMIGDAGLRADDVEGIGMGVPGPVSDGILGLCANLGQWGGFDAAAELSRLCGIRVRIANDANVAALGECFFGAGRGCRSMMLVTLGTGIGGALIADGKLVLGAHGAAGEIGHIKVKDDERIACGCGKTGCLEQYASASGMVRTAEMMLENSDRSSSLRGFANLSCKDLFDSARSGDHIALEVVDGAMRVLAKALAAASCVFDPEMFVIGGGVSEAGEIVLEILKRAYFRYAFPSCEKTVFALAKLKGLAGVYGGVRLVTDDDGMVS